MKHTKKLLSLLLAAVMLVGMIPAISVNAAEAPTTATAVSKYDATVFLAELPVKEVYAPNGKGVGTYDVLYVRNGKEYTESFEKSLFTHAQPNGADGKPAYIRFDISAYTGSCDVSFESFVGFRYKNGSQTQKITNDANAKYLVYADGELIYSTEEIKLTNDLQKLHVTVPQGTKVLSLELDCVKAGAYGHSNDWCAWYAPRITPAVYLADLEETYSFTGTAANEKLYIGKLNIMYTRDGALYNEEYEKSIFLHARSNHIKTNPTLEKAAIEYDVSDFTAHADALFESFAGIRYTNSGQTNNGKSGSVKFNVYADGTLVATTDTITPALGLQTVSAVIPKGTETVRLETDCSTDDQYGHANDWGTFYVPRIIPNVKMYLAELPIVAETCNYNEPVVGTDTIRYSATSTATFEKSIFTHANNPAYGIFASVSYNISDFTASGAVTFNSAVGILDEYVASGKNATNGNTAKPKGEAHFNIYADGVLVGQAKNITPYLALDALKVSAVIPAGTQILKLEVDHANQSQWGHDTDWCLWGTPYISGISLGKKISYATMKADKQIFDIGEEKTLSVEGYLADGTAIDTSKLAFSFSSDNENVVSVDESGKLTAVGAGVAKVTAKVTYGKEAEATMLVAVGEKEGEVYTVTSPDNSRKAVLVVYGGEVYYSVLGEGTQVGFSKLGMLTTGADLTSGLTFVSASDTVSIDETYTIPARVKETYENKATERTFTFTKNNLNLDIVLRAYNDGAAFRYIITSADGADIVITNEATKINVPADTTVFAMPYTANYEGYYKKYTYSDMVGAFCMPLIMKNADGSYVLVSDSDTNSEYSGTKIEKSIDGFTFVKTVSASANLTVSSPFKSAWRAFITGELSDIVESSMITDLAPAPDADIDWSFVKAGMASWTWGSGGQDDKKTHFTGINKAAEMGWDYYTLDYGWHKPAGDADGNYYYPIKAGEHFEWVPEVVEYANEKGVKLIVWVHKKNADTEEEMKAILKDYADLGMAGIKIDFFDGEDAATMKLYEDVFRECAKLGLVVNTHGSTKPSGESRTWPNLLTREAVRGEEFAGRDNGMTPEQYTILPFTRGVVGPADVTEQIDSRGNSTTTAGSQIAISVVMASGIHHNATNIATLRASKVYDLYKNFPAAWDDTKLLYGEVGENIGMARRSGNDWYIGGLTVEADERDISLSFLPDGIYLADIYTDNGSRTEHITKARMVDNTDTIPVSMAYHGGYVIRLTAVDGETAPEAVTITEETVEITNGNSYSLDYSVESGNATIDRVIFESTNDAVAKVDNNGTVTATGAGIATVKAISPVDLSVYDSVAVYVNRTDADVKEFDVSSTGISEVGDVCDISFTASADEYTLYDSAWNKIDLTFTETANGDKVDYKASFIPEKSDVYSVIASDGREVSFFTVNMTVTVYFDDKAQKYTSGELIDLPVLSDKEDAVFAGWYFEGHTYYGEDAIIVPTGKKEVKLTSVFAENGKAIPVYVDEANGNNSNSGFAYNKAVADWFKAFEILAEREGDRTVYIIGKYTPSSKVTPVLNAHVNVFGVTPDAEIDFNGQGADFKSPLTFENITITSNARYGFLNTFGNAIVFGDGTKIINNQNANTLALHSGRQNANGGKENVTVNTGKFDIYSGSYYNFDFAKNTAGALYTVNGGEVYLRFQADGYTNNAGVHVGSRFSDDVIVVHNGGILTVYSHSSEARPVSLEKNLLIINNYGTTCATNDLSAIVAGGTYIVNSANGGHVEAVSGNTIKLCPDEGKVALVNGKAVEGEVFTLKDSGEYTVTYVDDGFAMIGTKVYATLGEAFENADTADVVKLIKPLSDETVAIPSGITLDAGNLSLGTAKLVLADEAFVKAQKDISANLCGENNESCAVNVKDGVYTYVTAAHVENGCVTSGAIALSLGKGKNDYGIVITRSINGTIYTLDVASETALTINANGTDLTFTSGTVAAINLDAGAVLTINGGDAGVVTPVNTEGTVKVLKGEGKASVKKNTLGGIVEVSGIGANIFTGWNEDDVAQFTTAEMYGMQIRIKGVQGLRFIAKLEGDYEESLTSYGLVILPENLIDGELTLESERVAVVSSTQEGFKIFSRTDDMLQYTACITGITPNNYDRNYAVRAFIKYMEDGVEKTVYSNIMKGNIVETVTGLKEQFPGEYDELYDTIMNDYTATFTSTNEFKQVLKTYSADGIKPVELDFTTETAISSLGEDIAVNGFKSTDFISTENYSIVQYVLSAASGVSSLAFYDKDKNFLECVTTEAEDLPYSIIIYDKKIPENAAYVRFSAHNEFSLSKASLCDDVGEMLFSYISKDKTSLAGKKIVCLGDSLTFGDYGTTVAGKGYPHEENYPYFLEKYTGADVEWYAGCGYTAADLASDYSGGVMYSEKAGKTVDLKDADYIIIMAGTNGGLELIGDRTNYDSYLTLVQSIRSDIPGAQVILVTPPHATEDETKVNYGYMPNVSSAYSGVYKIAEICVVPVFDAFRDSGIDAETEEIMQPNDGLHFGGIGYASFAAYITNQLKLLEKGRTEALSYSEIVKAQDEKFLETIEYPTYKTADGAYATLGRWFKKDIDGVTHDVTLNSGAELYFITYGAQKVTIDFTVLTSKSTPYYAVYIDNGDAVRYPITENVITLPDSERHAVRIVMDGMTESEGKWDGEIGYAIKGITADNGETRAIYPENDVIFYFGDSITEGINALGTNGDGASNSAVNTYSHISAKALSAMPYIVGYGASGIIAEGSFNTMLEAMDNLSADRAENDTVKPATIVINHGYNDEKLATGEKFKTALRATLSRLVEKYPDTPVYYAIPFAQKLASEIRAVCAEFDGVKVIETFDYDITYSADGIHPSAAGAKVAGERIASAIEKDKLSTNEYDKYIYYRKSLQNTYARLTNDKELNVAYYGGSITQGYGASATENNWRLRTRRWFEKQFPEAKINEIYAAFGESGTFLGSYILDDFVLAKKPDLVFIEYAINDTYAGFTKERAAMQFETIVREIKEAYPKCDIVTLISIDQGRSAYDWFYPTALGHAEISEAYNIPLIFMGKALSDHISAEGKAWSTYFRDIVHPLDPGYSYYTDVIIEYLKNSLVATDLSAEYLPDDVLPAVVSEKLLSGKRSIVYAPDIPLANNAGWTYKSNVNTADPLLGSRGCVATDITDSTVFTYTFTGNDFSIYTNIHDKNTQFTYTVKDANGNVEKTGTGKFASHNPTTIVEGLANGTHTITVSPVKSTVASSITQMYIDMVLVRNANG